MVIEIIDIDVDDTIRPFPKPTRALISHINILPDK
jgi:hypothetical protein